MSASDTMTRNVVVVSPDRPLGIAWRIMNEQKIRHLPVVREGALVGMLSDRDLRDRARVSAGKVEFDPSDCVNDAMTPTPLLTCEATTTISELAQTMIDAKVDAVPVVRGLRLVGLVTSTDLLSLLIEREDARVIPYNFRLFESDAAYAS